jgi:hypothetical protein
MLVWMLCGCAASLPHEPEVDGGQEKIVAGMAQARWDAIVRGDYDKAYGMLSPGSRTLIRKEDFIGKSGRVSWISADVRKVDCSGGDVCEVEVDAKYSYQARRVGKVESNQHLKEKWRSVDGTWWYVFSDM